MKLSPRAYSIFWDAHAWAGAIASLILFTVFFLGAFALFAEELAPWQEPSFRTSIAVDDGQALTVAQRIVDAEAAIKPAWFGISLPTDEEPWLRIWRMNGAAHANSFVDPVSGETFDQRSELGDFLNEMHFLEPLPFGREIAGVASLVLIFLAGTGLLLQLGNLRRELVRVRPHTKQRRVFWSDAHKVIGVVSLPFFLLFGFTGAMLCLDDSLRPAIVAELFDGDSRAMSEISEWPEIPGPSGVAAPAPDLRAAYAKATELYPEATHRWFFIANLGDVNTIVDLPGEEEGRIGPFTNVRLSANGEVLWTRDAGGTNAYARAAAALYGLHFASWADAGGKAVYATLAFLAAFGILAGNLLWIERRRAKGLGRFDRFLARLTAGGCAGLPFAVSAIFLANQLLPVTVEGRIEKENGAFIAAWIVGVAFAFVAPGAAFAARRLLLASGSLFLCLPLIDALRTGRIPFDPRSPWIFATETGLAVLGLIVIAAAVGTAKLERRFRANRSAASPSLRPPEAMDSAASP